MTTNRAVQPATTPEPVDVPKAVTEPPQQRRILTVLVVAQVLSGAGLAAGITVGALLAQEMLGSTSLAGLPSALFTIGSAAAAVSVGRISQRAGRRTGLALGYGVGAVGSAGVVLAAVLNNVALLFVALFVYGAGTASNLQARYAGADLAHPSRRGRAVSTVLVATTLGAVVGPNLVAVLGDLARTWHIPPLAGPFILAAVAYGAAGITLWLLLRPDPLLLARDIAAAGTAPDDTTVAGQGAQRRLVVTAATVMIVAQLVMVAIMTMTPVHMLLHGHSVAAAGLVIAIHVGAMFLPSPLSGWLVDRFGPQAVAVLSGITLLAAGSLAMIAPVHSVAVLAVALALLGLGWSFGLVSGSSMLATALPLATRARTQGSVDLCIAVAGAVGGLASGIVVAVASYPVLAIGGGLVAAAVVPVIALTFVQRLAR